MIPEKVFQQILALGDAWQVTPVDYVEPQRKVLIRVEETLQLWPHQRCPHCESGSVAGYDHAPERHWRHLNVCQLESEIVGVLPRGQCRDCRKVFTVRAPWEGRGRGFTQEFEAFAMTLMREMAVNKVGEILGADDPRLWRMIIAHMGAAWAALSWENGVWVGADEMNRRKRRDSLTVFVDQEAKRVLLAVEGKDAGMWERFAEQLLAHNGHPKVITQVAIDRSPAYRKGVQNHLGNATIVYDQYHVVSAGVKAVAEVRRTQARQDAGARAELEKTHWLWRKNPERCTEREAQRWEQLRDKPLVTGLAYAMRLELQRAYASKTGTIARKKFQAWCGWVRTEADALKNGLLEPMRRAAMMVTRHLEGILGHWEEGLTTAYLEGLNSLFSAAKRKARGYRSNAYQIAMLYFVAAQLTIPHY